MVLVILEIKDFKEHNYGKKYSNFYDLICKIENLIYALKKRKKMTIFDWWKNHDKLIISKYFLSTSKPEPSWTFWHLICKIWALSLRNILLWTENGSNFFSKKTTFN